MKLVSLTLDSLFFGIIMNRITLNSHNYTQKVANAAEELYAQGVPLHKITNIAIRQKIGNGSFRDIQPLLKIWKEEKEHGHLERCKTPHKILEFGEEFASKLYKEAILEVNREMERQIDEVRNIKVERDDLYNQVDDLTLHVEKLSEKIREGNTLFLTWKARIEALDRLHPDMKIFEFMFDDRELTIPSVDTSAPPKVKPSMDKNSPFYIAELDPNHVPPSDMIV